MSQMSLMTSYTAVSYVDLLGRLVASRNLGKFAHVTDSATAGFLTVDPVEAGGLPLLDLLNLVLLVTATKRAVCLEFRWHLHKMSLVWV